ncbi:hypothetical protein GDO86_003604 [Hymenochirus boettgeri]|uniref:O(6)-methylguanine-induced apoptosis 2 n=1 Tax=Hymenochirus boettgeri TaxID=247094 RepID=A0A8T2KA52_9PIPI|nr:hypothetical protein GDO86_003604 [Hymenochirus boettgeri]
MDLYVSNADSQGKTIRRKPHSKSIKVKQEELPPNSSFRIPVTPSSIPTKYQTVYIPVSERKGFNSRSLRFFYSIHQNENPGPGTYNVGQIAADINSASLSKKGTGGFPSKVSRTLQCKIARTPAPNKYDVQKEFFSKKDFSKGNSSMFQQPIAIKVEDKKHTTPSPNHYNATTAYCHPNNNVSAHSVFASKTKRELLKTDSFKGPSPCHYTIKDTLVKESPKVLVSCFKSKTSRNSLNVASNNPGPANYDPYKSPDLSKKNILMRKHYLSFSAPAMPVAKTPPVPGPGHYEIVDYQDPPKHYISSAVFVSNTSRWAGEVSDKIIPGPGTYYPEIPGKHSFLNNSDKKWIPA